MIPGCFHTRVPALQDYFKHLTTLVENELEEVLGGVDPSGASSGSANASAVLFHGGTIRTMADDQETVEAILIQGDHILALGSLEDVRAKSPAGTKETDLKGRTMLPGFIDPHMHITGSITSAQMLDLSPNPNSSQPYDWDYCKSILLEAVKAAPNKDTLITGAGIDPSQFPEWVNPTFRVFDEMFGTDDPEKQNPVLLMSGSGHITFVNRRAALQAKLDLSNPPPVSGGKAATYLENRTGEAQGDLSGVFLELPGQSLVMGLLASTPDQLIAQVKNLLPNAKALFHSAVANGNTMLNEASLGIVMGVNVETRLLKAIQYLTGHKVRIGSARYFDESSMPAQADLLTQASPDVSNPMFLQQAVKLFADGSNQGGTGLMRNAYTQWAQDRIAQDYMGTDTSGLEDCQPQLLTQLIAAANRRGWQVMIHANGDGAIDNALVAFDDVDKQGLLNRDLRHRIEHCSILHDNRVGMMKDLGISPSFLIEHVVKWGPVLKKMLGDERVELLDRCKTAHDAGMVISMHSDYTVTDMLPLKRVQDAVTRMTEGPDGGWVLNEAECLPIDVALKAQTRFAAWQCHADQYVGTLEANKKADLVILDDDPVVFANTNRADQIASIGISETWVNGRCVYQAADQQAHAVQTEPASQA